MSESEAIQTSQQAGVTIVKLGPHFDSIYESVLSELAPLIHLAETADPPRLVIDLAYTRYTGSAFIGFVISLSTRLNSRPGGRLGLANVTPFCRMALETTRTDSLLDLFGSVDEAVSALGWQ